MYVCTFIQPQYVDLDRRYHGTPILYCTILHYTTRIYLSIRLRELVIRCATYLPTYLLSVSMVWYGMGRWQNGHCQLSKVVSQMII